MYMQLVYIQILPMFLNFPLQNKSEEESFKSMTHPVISESAIKMKMRNCKERLDNLERQTVLFHKVKIFLQNNPELADTFLNLHWGLHTSLLLQLRNFS